LKFPFTVRVTRLDSTTYKRQEMNANVPVDDRRLEKPAEKPVADKPADKNPKF
jgi:hypothetical protein